MSITETPLCNNLVSHKKINLGNLYFFKTFLVAEYYEGVRIDFESFNEAQEVILSHFGTSEFGYVANRVNSYCINITDAPLFNATLKNLKAHATVTYNSFSDMNFELESYFFDFNRKLFKSLFEATSWVKNELVIKKY